MKNLDPLREHFQWLVALFPERLFIISPQKDGIYPSPFSHNLYGNSYVVMQGEYYCYTANDRGVETARDLTDSIEEIKFWISRDYTRWLASRYELKNRRLGEDSRRQWMGLHVKLLERVEQEWARRMESFYNSVLKEYPFRDDKQPRTVNSETYSIGKGGD